jgi:hypothetical protein
VETTFSITETQQGMDIPNNYFTIDPTYRSVSAPNN